MTRVKKHIKKTGNPTLLSEAYFIKNEALILALRLLKS